MAPVAFVGDIHGDAVRLERLLEQSAGWKRRLVFLGDYVNRGPDSSRVLELVVSAVEGGHVALLGNHDHAFLQYLEGRLAFAELAAMGGASTIRSYVAEPHGDVLASLLHVLPAHHITLLRGLRPYWETDSILASHVGYDPANRGGRSLDDVALRGHSSIFYDPDPPLKLVVCGHYTQELGRPYVTSRLVCLDTGCGSQGPLSALLWPELQVVQF